MTATVHNRRPAAVTDQQLDDAFGPVAVLDPPAPRPVLPAADRAPKFWQRPPLTGKPDVPYIYAALHAAMEEIRSVSKSERFEQGNTRYSFRGIDGVMSAAGPAFRTHGIIPQPTLLTADYRDTRTTGDKATREVVVRVRYTFTALDGSSVQVEVPGESLDQSDKGTAKAMSVAYRIALLQLLCIPTDEPDPDATYHTRDGSTEIAPSVARHILERIEHGTLEELGPLWQIVLEHSAADRTAVTDDAGSVTWYDVFAGRWVTAINAIETFPEGKAVGDAVDAAGVPTWRVGNSTIAGLLEARAVFLRERTAAASRAVTDALEAAQNIEQVDAVAAMLIEYAGRRHLRPPATERLRQLIEDKRAAIETAAADAGESTTP